MSTPHQILRSLTTGVYVITATHEGLSGGFTAAWVTQIAFEPLLVAISINRTNATWPLIEGSGRFALNVLKTGQLDLARRFGTTSGREADKLTGVGTATVHGVIRLTAAPAWLECHVAQQLRAGDGEHVLVLARVVGGEVLDAAAVPMRYAETGDMDGSSALYPAAFPKSGSGVI